MDGKGRVDDEQRVIEWRGERIEGMTLGRERTEETRLQQPQRHHKMKNGA